MRRINDNLAFHIAADNIQWFPTDLIAVALLSRSVTVVMILMANTGVQ